MNHIVDRGGRHHPAHRAARAWLPGMLVLALASSGPAQDGSRWHFDARSGPVIPAGDLADIADVGIAAGGGLAYRFHTNFAARVDVDGAFFEDLRDSRGVLVSQMNLLHVTAGIETLFAAPEWQDLPLTSSISGGVGITRMHEDESLLSAGAEEFAETYFTVQVGAKIGYRFGRVVGIYASGRGYLILIKEADTQPLALRSTEVGPFGATWSVPITVGLRVSP